MSNLIESRWRLRAVGLRLDVVRAWSTFVVTPMGETLAEGSYEACKAAERLLSGRAEFGMRGDF